jgi:hypothetical protein
MADNPLRSTVWRGCRQRRTLALLAALALLAPAVAAEEGDPPPRFTFGVFGTLGLVYSTEDRADFIVNPVRPDGPGRSKSVSPDPDSLIAGQVTFQATPKLTAVVQVVAEQTADDDYDPNLEWANLRYEFTPDFSVRAGRLALPAFLVSEHRKVSYATPWIRPPIELYSIVPVTSLDGVEATFRRHSGDWTRTFDASFGRSEAEFPGGAGSAVAKDAWNVNATFERGGFTGRVAAATAKLDVDAFEPLFNAFRLFGPEGESIAERFEVDETPFVFATAGVEYDPGRWFAIAEVGWLDTDSVLGESLAGYVTGGVRLGSVAPYATYSRREVLSESSARGLSLAGLPPDLIPVAAGLNAGLNGILRGTPVQQNLAVGGRWDFTTGMALKLQVDFVDVLEGSAGTFSNQTPGSEPIDDARLVSLAAVFVF